MKFCAACLLLALVAPLAGCASLAPDPPLTVEEILLRAKPAVTLLTTSVAADVQVDCEGEVRRGTMPAFEETGTAWFIDPNGFLITNAHVVQQAYASTAWLKTDFADRAAEAACVPVWLERLKVTAGERPDVEESERILPGLPDERIREDAAWFLGLSRKQPAPPPGPPALPATAP